MKLNQFSKRNLVERNVRHVEVKTYMLELSRISMMKTKMLMYCSHLVCSAKPVVILNLLCMTTLSGCPLLQTGNRFDLLR